MELALSLGDSPKPFTFLEKTQRLGNNETAGFCMELGGPLGKEGVPEMMKTEDVRRDSSDPPVLQLNLLPFSPVPLSQTPSQLHLPWLTENTGSSNGGLVGEDQTTDDRTTAAVASPNRTVSSFQMDFSSICRSVKRKRSVLDNRTTDEVEMMMDRGSNSSRASDEEENGSACRKKLRLSKEQSAFLEESFKEHHTLNQKQKLALAKQLNLRLRQVEVWFQNRRARTKLKQTEIDCDYLKRCCEKLTEENRRLQKELQELRALKASQPFYKQLPATTLTMCPSCERVASVTNSSTSNTSPPSAAVTASTSIATTTNTTLSLTKSIMLPFP